MKPKNSGSGRRIVCLVLVAVMLLGLISSALIIMVNAASSSEIKKELNGLRSQQAELKKEREALQAKIKENQSKTQTLVEKKSDIDQQISMTQASIDNLNEQVQQYSLLIANKQADLEASQAEEQRLNTQYKTRIRSMEETGSISYWAILFGANSFSDLLDKIDVIQEIAKADQLMMDKMKAVSEQIAAERAELEQQMAELDATRQELDQQEQDLEAQRAEQDTLLTEMLAAYEEMNADYMQNMADEAALSEEIAKSESAYYAALSKEEAERIAALNRQNNNKGSSSNSSGATNTGGWLYPLPYQCQVTDSYGYRIHPLTKKYSWHNGVDFGAAAGTAILAAKSGTVTTAAYSGAWGYYVVINHGDGYSTPLRTPAVPVRVGRRLRHAGSDHRLCRLHRLLHRPAPALHHLLQRLRRQPLQLHRLIQPKTLSHSLPPGCGKAFICCNRPAHPHHAENLNRRMFYRKYPNAAVHKSGVPYQAARTKTPVG